MRGWMLMAVLLASACGKKLPPCPEGTVSTITKEFRPDDDELAYWAWCVDRFVASRIDASSTSPGLDESYAVSQAGVVPWTHVTYDEAQRACLDAGKILCSGVGQIGFEVRAPVVNDPFVSTILRTGVWKGPDQPDGIDDGHAAVVWMNGRLVSGQVSSRRMRPTSNPTRIGDYEPEDRIESEEYPVLLPGFRSPFLGFRCCVRQVFAEFTEPVREPGTLVRPRVDPQVLGVLEP